jgi:signal transduction histidine kinase
MALSWLRAALPVEPARTDEQYARDMLRRSLVAILLLAIVEIETGVLTLVAGGGLWRSWALSSVGALTALAAQPKWCREHGRFVTAASVWCSVAVLCAGAGLSFATQYWVVFAIALLMLAAIALAPFHPLEVLALGGGLEVLALVFGWIWGALPIWYHIFILCLTIGSAAVSAVLAYHRISEHRARQEALRVTEALSSAQLRAQLAENAASIGKLAAALTHEINTPLGALKSSVDTLVVLSARQAAAPPDKQRTMVQTQAELRRSIRDSSERITKVIGRLQRFISLEEAELKPAKINDLLSDVAVMHEDHLRDIRLEFDFRPMPEVMCRPQLLTAVFSTLLSNAINALNENGQIVVSTRCTEARIEISFKDNGRGIAPKDLETIFDPTFRVSGSSISSGNWGLFNTRQIVYEHGGDIEVESRPDQGTSVRVTLPC